jgi:hypothetical protein
VVHNIYETIHYKVTLVNNLLNKKFNYKVNTVYALIRDAKSGKIALFPDVKKGPAQRRTSQKIQEKSPYTYSNGRGKAGKTISSTMAE